MISLKEGRAKDSVPFIEGDESAISELDEEVYAIEELADEESQGQLDV